MAEPDEFGAEAVELLRKAVSIKSYSGEERKLAEFLVGEMEKLGFRQHIDGAGNAIGVIGDENSLKTLLFAGHMDTVPGEIQVRVENDSEGREALFGRGSVDAKGPLCAFICAAGSAARDGKIPSGLRIVVAGCVEEECASSKGARHLIGKYQPDMIIIGEPSGTDGITLGYKGRLNIDYSIRAEEAHGASENKGAGEQAVGFYNALVGYAAGFNQGSPKVFEQLQVRLRGLNTSSDGFYERAEMGISLRIPPGCIIEEVIGFLEENRGEAELRFSGKELPIKAEKNNQLVRAFVKAIREAGLEPCFKLKTGTSDMNVLGEAYPGVPILAYGPGDSALDHTPDEHILIEDYLRAIKIAGLAIRNISLSL